MKKECNKCKQALSRRSSRRSTKRRQSLSKRKLVKYYIDLIGKKLTKGNTEEEVEFIFDKLYLGIIIFVCLVVLLGMFIFQKTMIK